MGLVIFAWLTAQSYFKDSTNIDIRKLMLEENNMLIDESMTPFGFVDNGLQEDVFEDGEERWQYAEKRGFPMSRL
jgi:hypothetical protein